MKIFSSSFSSALPPQGPCSSSRFHGLPLMSAYAPFRPYQVHLRLSDRQMSGRSFHPLPLVLAPDSFSVQCCRPLHSHFDIPLRQKHPACFLPSVAKKSHQKHPSLYRPLMVPPLRFLLKSRRRNAPLHHLTTLLPRFVTTFRRRHCPLNLPSAAPPRFVTTFRRSHWPAGCPVDGCRAGGTRGYGDSTRGPPG